MRSTQQDRRSPVTRILVQEQADGCCVLALDSADGTNRLSPDLLEELARLVELHASAQGVIVTGNAAYFSVGADLEEIHALEGASGWVFARRGQQALSRIAASRAPVIAAIEGFCMGGGVDLALACHARLCTSGARFGHRGAALGLVTGWGGTQRLPRLIGTARALDLFVSASVWNAEEARAAGLVQAVSPPAQLLAQARTMADRLTRGAGPDGREFSRTGDLPC